jgi:GNAT superfamily N-acetyltransferase
METIFRKATEADAAAIWEILQAAIARRKAEGSTQWQDGYPNPSVIAHDIALGHAYVLSKASEIQAYCAILVNNEPEYANIQGQWLSNGNFVVYHRVAVAEHSLGQGLAKRLFQEIENFAQAQGIKSLKADTNFDNAPMLSLFQKEGYVYCGEVFFRGTPRKAFEKLL